MRKTLTVSLLAVALAGFASAAEMKVAPTTSKIEFIGTKTGGRHTGGFREFTGTVAMPGADQPAELFGRFLQLRRYERPGFRPAVGDAGGVDQYPAPAGRRPGADLDQFVAVHQQGGPGLFQGQGVVGHDGMVGEGDPLVK